MGCHQSLKSKNIVWKKFHFTSLMGYDLNFLTNLDLQLLGFELKHQLGCGYKAATPNNDQEIQIVGYENNKMHPFRHICF